MRLIQLRVDASDDERVSDVLDEEGIDHVTSATSDGGVLVQFPMPTQGVDYAIEALQDADVDTDYTVVVTAETAETARFNELENRFVAGNEEDDSIARSEIRSKAIGMNPSALTYYSMTLLSAFVATAGLLLDAPTIVVGSMVIAPQVGSALTASVGATLNDREMVVDGLRSQVLGLALAILGAAAFGWFIRSAEFVPAVLDVTTSEQISQRVSPGVLSAAVAVFAGAAGAFGLATALPVSLVGVMIAAALIPAAAAAGIGVAWGSTSLVGGGVVLLLVNTVAINLSTMAVLWGFDYRPVDWDGVPRFERPRRFVFTFGTVVILVVALLVTATTIAGHVTTTNAVNEEVQKVLSEDRYAALALVNVQTEFVGLGSEKRTVIIVVSRPADAPYPTLARTMATQLSAATESRIAVEIEFVERSRAG